jgi:GT2 family glycosyltransferase
MMESAPRVAIIVLNWNGWRDTVECLDSLYQIQYPAYDVIVADNGSEDGSVERIREYAEGTLPAVSPLFNCTSANKPLCLIRYTREEAEAGGGKESRLADAPPDRRLILIENGGNFGFPEGNNIAIRYAMKALDPEYILLLNNDTIVDPAFLDDLVKTAESDRRIGFIGPKIYYYDYHGRTDIISFAGGRIQMAKGRSFHIGDTEPDRGQYDTAAITDYVEGSCLLVRREVLSRIGLMDPAYFLYWEEMDWIFRGAREGFTAVYCPTSRIWHKVSASSCSANTIYYMTRNRFLFMRKNSSPPYMASFLLYTLGINLWATLTYYFVFQRDPKKARSLIRGTLDGLRLLV